MLLALFQTIIVFTTLLILMYSFYRFEIGLALAIVMIFIDWSLKPPIASLDIFPFIRINEVFLFLGWLFNISKGKLKIPYSKSANIYWLYIIICFISAILAFQGTAILVRASTYLEPIMFFYFSLSIVYSIDKSKYILYPILIGVVIYVFYGIIELIFQYNILFSSKLIFLDIPYLEDIRFFGSGRISLPIGQPVYAAALLLILIPILSYIKKEVTGTNFANSIVGIIIFLSFVLILYTGTRSAYLTAFLMLLSYMYLFQNKKAKIFLIAVLFTLVWSGILFPDMFDFLINSFNPTNRESVNVLQRFDLTSRLAQLFVNHMIWGYGPGVIQKIASSSSITKFIGLEGQENQYFMILAETGILGLTFYLLYVTNVFREVIYAIKNLVLKQEIFAKYLFIACVGLFSISISVMMLNSPLMHIFMLLLGMNSANIIHHKTKKIKNS